VDPLTLLTRKDKWFLGGGKGALYAPPFPRFLTSPGYWDESYFADLRLDRLFTVLFLDEQQRPLRFRSAIVDWRPDRLVLLHEAGDSVIEETRCVLAGQAWTSTFEKRSGGPKLTAIVWSLLEERPAGIGTPWQSFQFGGADPALYGRFSTAWPAEIEPDRTAVESENLQAGAAMLPPLELTLAWGADRPRSGWLSRLAQRHDISPVFETSMLPEIGGLIRIGGDHVVGPGDGLRHLYQAYVWDDDGPLQVAAAAGLEAGQALQGLQSALKPGAAVRNQADWRAYFESVPQFESSDPYLNAAYWYRWYGLRLNTVDVPGLPMRTELGLAESAPYVTEGIGFFRNFITYSAQAHLREVAWMHESRLAESILQNLTKVQRSDGSYPGHNYSARPPRDFYHADFASGASLLEKLHGQRIAPEVRSSLIRYAAYLSGPRRFESAGPSPMVWVKDQNETGQEYMSRYLAANERADEWGEIRLGGVDGTTYLILLQEFLGEDATPFRDALAKTKTDGFFADVLADGRLSDARPASGLYPYLLVSAGPGIEKWLGASAPFDLPAGYPATSKDDPTFSAEAEWKDRRTNCPWNGRSWPMVNSHLVDALAHSARTANLSLKELAGAALMKAIRLLFHDGDPTRPCCYEHYNPVTGVPALFRGYDDYMHSWVVDLTLRHAVGFQPSASGDWACDPLPTGVEWIRCGQIPHRGERIDVEIRDGKPAA